MFSDRHPSGKPAATLGAMIQFPNLHVGREPPQISPQRRRVIIIGAGPTGMSAAFHLGEHALLLDRRAELEEGHFDVEDSQTFEVEHKAVVLSCASPAEQSGDSAVIHIRRWLAPVFRPSRPDLRAPSVRMLAPLLSGELRLNACVVRIDPSQRQLELADGARFTYDKLLCALPRWLITPLVIHELPGRIRHDASLRFWLQDRDIEISDHDSRRADGDVDEFSAGKRLAEQIATALSEKFGLRGHAPRPGAVPLFKPRLV